MRHSTGGTGELIPQEADAAAHLPNSQVLRGATAEGVAGRDNEAPSTFEILDIERRQRMAAA